VYRRPAPPIPRLSVHRLRPQGYLPPFAASVKKQSVKRQSAMPSRHLGVIPRTSARRKTPNPRYN
jgi:hypothetical protein